MEHNTDFKTGACINVVVDDNTVKQAVVMSTNRTHIRVYMCGSVAMVNPSKVIGRSHT